MLQKASALSNPVVVAKWVAFAEKVEAEWSCYKEPQPLVAMSLSQTALPFRKRLRLRDVETKSLSLYIDTLHIIAL